MKKKLIEASLDEYIKRKAIKIGRILLCILIVGIICTGIYFMGHRLLRNIRQEACSKTRDFVQTTLQEYKEFYCAEESGAAIPNVGF